MAFKKVPFTSQRFTETQIVTLYSRVIFKVKIKKEDLVNKNLPNLAFVVRCPACVNKKSKRFCKKTDNSLPVEHQNNSLIKSNS
jgi:hypothetical protein